MVQSVENWKSDNLSFSFLLSLRNNLRRNFLVDPLVWSSSVEEFRVFFDDSIQMRPSHDQLSWPKTLSVFIIAAKTCHPNMSQSHLSRDEVFGQDTGVRFSASRWRMEFLAITGFSLNDRLDRNPELMYPVSCVLDTGYGTQSSTTF